MKQLAPCPEAKKYDSFISQLVKDIRRYYLRTVLHDLPNEQALLVFECLRDCGQGFHSAPEQNIPSRVWNFAFLEEI